MKLIEGINSRYCTKCNKLKDFEDFAKNKKGKYGILSKCKECQNKYFKKHYMDKKIKYKD